MAVRRKVSTQKNLLHTLGIPVLVGVLSGLVLLAGLSLIMSAVDIPPSVLPGVGFVVCILCGIVGGAVSGAVNNTVGSGLLVGSVLGGLLLLSSALLGSFEANNFAALKLILVILSGAVGAFIAIKLGHSSKRRRAMR